MDARSEKYRVADTLRSVFIYDPLPGVTVDGVARKIGIKPDTLRKKFADSPNATTVAELIAIFSVTGDRRLADLVCPDGCLYVDISRFQTGHFKRDTSRLLADVTKELTDVPVSLASATADGVVDEGELFQILRECDEAQIAVEQVRESAKALVHRQPYLFPVREVA